MTFLVISILVGCLSVMTARGRQGNWPSGMPVTRPRLVAAGGTYAGRRGRPTDAYVIQERLVAVAHGANGEPACTAAALALGAVVAARPQYQQDLDECAQLAHRAVRTAALRDASAHRAAGTAGVRDASAPELVSTLDVVVLEPGERPRLRFVHVGDGAIWHCPKGGAPQPLTTPHSFAEAGQEGRLLRGLGLPSALNPEAGSVPLRPGDRVVIVSDGVVRALGAARMKELFTDGASPGACLDRLYDEMAAAEPEDDATVIIADYVTA
ncbi:protein phosphatase 2C domain-containing protein [Nonomuraea sp. NPDC050786]|uniref:PP2C family protein-serine/threonine phosphatase n=1 Tax=Nonomuraea sp. NPDC050786 TaxID=3154840 RepID=UPI0033FD49B8